MGKKRKTPIMSNLKKNRNKMKMIKIITNKLKKK